MFCGNCGTRIEEGAVFCPKCGVNLTQNNTTGQYISKNTADSSSIGFGILSALIPLIGLILFLIWMKSKPKKAKSCGIGALIGFVIGIIFSFAI